MTRIWLIRLFMALLLFFGSEILLWIDPPSRSWDEWLLLGVGYLALSTLCLDLAIRYRIRVIYEAMAIAAIYALLAGMLLNPQTSYADFPRTLMTRVIGAHGLLALEMFGLFKAMTSDNPHYKRLFMGFSLWVGFYWGTWVRWSPSLTNWLSDEVQLSTMVAYAGGTIIAMLILYSLLYRYQQDISPKDLRLSPVSLLILIAVLIVLFMIQTIQENLTFVILAATLALVTLCLSILWYQRTNSGQTLLDQHIPPQLPSIPVIIISIVIFFVATSFAYHLPLLDLNGYNQLSLMEYGFAGLGGVWLPVITIIVSTRAIERSSRRFGD